jgi:hypothetical protein
MKRMTSSQVTEIVADCQACDWRADSVNALGLAARHHDATSHPVNTTITREITYGTAADLNRARETAGQRSLDVGETR